MKYCSNNKCVYPDIKHICNTYNFVLESTDEKKIPSSYYTDGKSFINVLNGDESRTNKNEVFIHYSPRWGRFGHNRWVMNSEYKLYRDGRFYNTGKDPLEKVQLSNSEEDEQKIKTKFEAILREKEIEFPFEWNDTEFKPGNK